MWTLTATGIATDGTSRTVTVTVNIESLFGLAAFGRLKVELRGSNSADSYRSGTFSQTRSFTELAGGSNICGDRMCTPTGHGVVATNAELYLLGVVIDSVDRAEVHFAREGIPDSLPGATGFCGGVPKTCSSPKLAYIREPVVLDPDPVVPPADLTNQGSFSGATLPAGRQLYTNMTLDSNTVVEGTPEHPSIVYLTGTLTIPNHAVVNFRPGGLVPKPSPGLLIFSGGVGPALRFGNHAKFSGAVYAPRATFSGGAAGERLRLVDHRQHQHQRRLELPLRRRAGRRRHRGPARGQRLGGELNALRPPPPPAPRCGSRGGWWRCPSHPRA